MIERINTFWPIRFKNNWNKIESPFCRTPGAFARVPQESVRTSGTGLHRLQRRRTLHMPGQRLLVSVLWRTLAVQLPPRQPPSTTQQPGAHQRGLEARQPGVRAIRCCWVFLVYLHFLCRSTFGESLSWVNISFRPSHEQPSLWTGCRLQKTNYNTIL